MSLERSLDNFDSDSEPELLTQVATETSGGSRKRQRIMSIIRTHPRKIAETPETPPAVAQNIRDTLR